MRLPEMRSRMDSLGEPGMTDDRNAEGYEPRFDLDYKFGEQAQLWVQDICKSLETDRIEVKYDAKFTETGHVYVETQCLRRGKYRPSGISITGAEVWVFVFEAGTSCVVVATETLKAACRTLWSDKSKHAACPRGSHPTKGLRVPLIWLLQRGGRIEGQGS